VKLAKGLSVLCALAMASAAWAQEAPTPPATASEVVITGKPPEVVDRIDRRVYNIEGDPQAQTGVVTDILKKLPSVSVDPKGNVALRGDKAVQILIDGKPPLDRNQLTNLAANQVASVEVITNPSAEYAADGTAGVINIVTKKRRPPGLTGGVNASLDSKGQGDLAANANLNLGKVTLNGALSGGRNAYKNPSSSRREILDGHGGVLDTQDQATIDRGDGSYVQGSAGVIYKPTDRSRFNLTGKYGTFDGDGRDETRSTGTGPGDTYLEASRTGFSGYNLNLDLGYEYTGPKDGETLTLDLNHAENVFRIPAAFTDAFPAPGPAAQTRTLLDSHTASDLFKADYKRGFSGKTLLTAGVLWRTLETRLHRTQDSTLPGVGALDHRFTGRETRMAAYATYQFPLGHWTALPGLRVETVARRFEAGASDADETLVFPSLHLSHAVGARGAFKLSYSRRVDRAGFQSYDGTIVYQSARSASAGNPALKSPTVDSYEAAYTYDRKDFGFIASLYWRARHDTLGGETVDIGSGVLLSRPVNIGDSHSGGAEFTLHGPLGAHWKYQLNGNLFDSQIRAFDGVLGPARDAFAWSGNGTLEYDVVPGGAEGDRFQINLQAYSAQPTGQGFSSAYTRFDAVWQHPVGRQWSLVVTAIDLLGAAGGHQITETSTLRLRSEWPAGDRAVKVALSWKFGG
jgi:ferric enterobactin receptor